MIEISGGAGGVTADLDAMAQAAVLLGLAAGDLGELAAQAAAVAADVDLLATAPLDPRGWAEAQAKLLRLTAGPRGLAALAVRVATLAGSVNAAAAGYAAADRLSAAGITAARDGAARTAGQQLTRAAIRLPLAVPAALAALQAAVLWRTAPLAVAAVTDAASDAADGDLRVDSLDERAVLLGLRVGVRLRDDADTVADAGLGWLAQHPETAEHLVAATPSLLTGMSLLPAGGPPAQPVGADGGTAAGRSWRFPPGDVDDLAALVVLLGTSAGVMTTGRVAVHPARSAPTAPPAPPGPPSPPRPPAGVADLVARAGALSPSSRHGSGEAGRIRVERVRSPHGRAAIVYVPATQDWGLARGNPMDSATNVRAMAGVETDAQAGVVEALRAAGVPREEPLLLVGHSQGGLTALGLASDAEFAAEFTPRAVLTVGAPAAGFLPAAGVEVLSLEHAEDLVTVLDGAPNPDRPSWTTIRRDVLDPADGDAAVRAAIGEDPLAPHDVEAYERTAAVVDAAEHRSLTAWRMRAAPFLAQPGATSEATEWVASRTAGTAAP